MYRYYLIGQVYLYIDTKEADDLALLHFHKSRVILENVLHKELGVASKKVLFSRDSGSARHFIQLGS